VYKRKKYFVLVLVIALLAAYTGCVSETPAGSGSPPPETTTTAGQPSANPTETGGTSESYKIVHLAPLTGNQSFQGEVLVNCAKMAVEEINAKGGINGVPIEYIPVDETSATATGIEAVHKAIDLKPDAIIGPNRSATAMAAHDLWKEAGIPTIIDASNTDANDPDNPYTFRIQLPAEKYIPILARTVKENYGEDKVGVIYANNEYAKGMWDGTLPALEQYDIEASVIQTFNDGVTDFSSQLLAIKNSGVKTLFMYCYEAEAALILRQRKELGLDVKVFSGRGADNPATIELVGKEFNEGMVCSTSLSVGDPKPEIQAFVEKYKQTYNDELSPTHANHYDSVYILADIIGRVGNDHEAVREELAKLDYKGTLAHYQADKNGDLVHTIYSQIYENGAWKLLLTESFPVEK